MALVKISNGVLDVTVDTVGAVFNSIVRNGTEYLWQGDAKYWANRDEDLFPYIGRLTEGRYIFKGQSYPMTIHGFARKAEFELEAKSAASASFVLCANDETRAVYPFEFAYHVRYELIGNRIVKHCIVENLDEKTMYFAVGSHPGFNVPVAGEGSFEDWYLEFEGKSEPERMLIDQETYRFSGKSAPYALKDGDTIPLTHSLFDDDAVILRGMPKTVTIKSDKSAHSVRVSYPDMPFVAFWHAVRTDAPYVCVEPWSALPSHKDYVEDIERQKPMISIASGETYDNLCTFDFR